MVLFSTLGRRCCLSILLVAGVLLGVAAQPVPAPNAKDELAKRKPRARTAETLYDLAMWAFDQKLEKEYRELLEEAIQQEPNHRACRWALGHRQRGDDWLTPEQAREKGVVACRGVWMTPEEAEKEKEASEAAIARNATPSGKPETPGSPGSFVKQVDVRGKKRPFRLIVPNQYDPEKPLPLLLWLHGDGGKMDSYVRSFQPVLNKGEFIFVSPESRRWQVWQEGTEGRAYEYARTDDDEYLELCLEQTMKEYNVDRNRIYVAGQSKGATYASKLARQHGEFYAAAGMINGVITSSYGQPSYRRAPFFVWFGSRDYLHPQYGVRIHVLKDDGHPVEFVYKVGAPHAHTQESIETMWEFLKKQTLRGGN